MDCYPRASILCMGFTQKAVMIMAAVVDQNLSYAEQANLLNTLYEQLDADFLHYQDTVSDRAADALQKLISDWQEWYWGEYYDAWPDSSIWQERYQKGKALLDAEKQAGATFAAKPKEYEPLIPEVIELPPLHITAKPPVLPPPPDIDMEIRELDYEVPEYEIIETDYGKPNFWPWLGLLGGILMYRNM
jgi:hypothetical protein